jgi:transcriptional regulator with XRE-family HTH domain
MPSRERIRQRREAAELSLEDVAVALREYMPTYSKQTVWKTEVGLRKLPADELPYYAKVLNCQVSDLLDPVPD